MEKTVRHLIVNEGNDTDKLRSAYTVAAALCASLGLTKLTILCNGLKGPTAGILTVITDRATAQQLIKGNTVARDGLTIELMSERTFQEYPAYDVLLGIYLGRNAIDKMDSASAVKGVVFLPWLKSEAKDWAQRWSPVIHGDDIAAESASTLPQPVVAALEDLSSLVNLSTGITHSSDKARAIETFKALRMQGHRCNPSEVKNWAIGHEWRPEDADDLAKLADRFLK